LHIDVALFSETHLKPRERFLIPNYHFYRIDQHPGRERGTAVGVRKGIFHNHVDLPPLVSVEATDCLENQFTPHDLCDENKEWQVEARVQALFEAAGNHPPERIRPCDLQILINSLKLRKACEIDGLPNECLIHLPRRPLVHLTNLINHCIWLSHFPTFWKEA
jgi:hypothetical protein